MGNGTNKKERKAMVTEIFVEGARKGLNIGTTCIIPNVLMAYVIIEILNISGILSLIGKAFGPLMALLGLPGEAITVLMAAWMSMPGGAGVAVSLFNEGLINGTHLTILAPAIFLMGAQIQYAGRLLGTAEVNTEHYGVLFSISVLNAIVAMIVMRILFV